MTSTTTAQNKEEQIIHIARIFTSDGVWKYLYLRKKGPQHYAWCQMNEKDMEEQTPVNGFTIDKAIQQANRHWKDQSITMLNCGFCYSLPERDEHGTNALFKQMVASYSSFNGIFFDEDLGYNCFINFASDEAKNLWKYLQKHGRI